MTKPHLIFTEHKNSFSVFVKNLEELSVAQIQTLQNFAVSRRGVFDFQTYTFAIHKKLNFYNFQTLLQSLELDCICEENIVVTQSQKRIGFGQYKGLLYTEIPDSYLEWLKRNYHGEDREVIMEESRRREKNNVSK